MVEKFVGLFVAICIAILFADIMSVIIQLYISRTRVMANESTVLNMRPNIWLAGFMVLIIATYFLTF